MNYSSFESTIMELLRTQLPASLCYHDLAHTQMVLDATKRIADGEGIGEPDRTLLLTAALLHDSGFTRSDHDNHETCSCDIAAEILPQHDYSNADVATVQELILATCIPQSPKTHLAQILCDADLDYLGTDQYPHIAGLLGKELLTYERVPDEQAWLHIQIGFLSKHTYFTQTARTTRRAGKYAHLENLRKRLDSVA